MSALVSALAVPAAGQDDDGSSREWNQPRGNAARTACVDVAPILSAPEVPWRLELNGRAPCSPVSWRGIVYAVATNDKGESALTAVDARSGAALATRALGKPERVDIAVLRGTVFVIEPKVARSVRFDGTKFSLGWTRSGSWMGQPAVARGCLILPDASSVHAVDPATGRDVVPPVAVDESSEPDDFAAVCVFDGGGPEIEIARLTGTVALRTAKISGLGTRTPKTESEDFVTSPFFAADRNSGRKPQRAFVVPVRGGWLATYSEGFYAKGDKHSCGAILIDRFGTGRALPVWTPVAVVGGWRGTAYGMSHLGTAHSVRPDGSYSELTRPGNLPKGARIGSPSGSGGVVYFGNWALETASGRVLWSLPNVDPVTPLIPVGDRRAVAVDGEGVLHGLVEPGAERPVAGEAGVADAPKSGGDANALPGDADGVLLSDGRFVPGAAAVDASGSVKLASGTGAAREFAAGTWVLVQKGGATAAVSEELHVLAALEENLDRRSADAWEQAFRRYATAPLVTDALRVLAAAKRDGLSDDRARELEKLTAGKRDHPNADLQRKRLEPEERALRDAWLSDVRAAHGWCRARGLAGAAAALLDRIRRERPDDAGVDSLARATLPAGFPWADLPDAGALWIDWAREIVPAGGTFVAPGAPEARKTRGAPWDAGVVLLRTRNVLLVSRSSDPAIVGACLRHAEGAIRACESILGPASPDAPQDAMEVRLHADRASYLAEDTPAGGRPAEWTAGYYSGAEKVSRFYVPGADETGSTPLQRTLLQVLAHEVTHQWIDLRWEPRGRAGPATPGYWAVEGVARFIEDQSVEMGRRRGRLDDATVPSLDVASRLAGTPALLKLEALVAMTRAEFLALASEPKVNVQMRNTARIAAVDPKDVFYLEGGALVFWLVHRRGPEGRAAFIAYLRDRYLGKVGREAATRLGFADAAEMEWGFRRFLAELRH